MIEREKEKKIRDNIAERKRKEKIEVEKRIRDYLVSSSRSDFSEYFLLRK